LLGTDWYKILVTKYEEEEEQAKEEEGRVKRDCDSAPLWWKDLEG
jgi:hypothetical protein